jgi:hypothetical protein
MTDSELAAVYAHIRQENTGHGAPRPSRVDRIETQNEPAPLQSVA